MYAFIRGRLTHVDSHFVTIETHGIGYKIHTPSNAPVTIKEINQEVLLYTSFVIREFAHTLYGFSTEQERNVFEMLIEISGIGPKLALNVISHLSLKELHETILQEDVARLSKVPGIGKKTAERLFIELRNKADAYFVSTSYNLLPNHQKTSMFKMLLKL